MDDMKNKLVNYDNIAGDILQEVTDGDIPLILEKLKSDWPHSMSICHFIEMRQNWKMQDPRECFSIFTPHKHLDTVICLSPNDANMVAMYTLEESCNQLKMALMNSKVINWEIGDIHIPFLHEKHKEVVVAILHSKIPLEKEYECVSSIFYYMPPEKAITIESSLPSEVFLSALNPSHAQVIFEEWPHKEETSVEYVEKMLKYNYSVGLFIKETGELICWMLDADYGLGMLHTVNKYRRKGYAKILVQHALRELGRMDKDIGLHIIVTNTPSRNLFKDSVGCIPVCNTTWILKSTVIPHVKN